MSKTVGYWFQCRECGETFESKDRDAKCVKCGNDFLRMRKIIKCDCGESLLLFDSMTNGCNCGREYNGSGQELAPRRFWGEETGETFENYHEDD
jgi:hypothetical protein